MIWCTRNCITKSHTVFIVVFAEHQFWVQRLNSNNSAVATRCNGNRMNCDGTRPRNCLRNHISNRVNGGVCLLYLCDKRLCVCVCVAAHNQTRIQEDWHWHMTLEFFEFCPRCSPNLFRFRLAMMVTLKNAMLLHSTFRTVYSIQMRWVAVEDKNHITYY